MGIHEKTVRSSRVASGRAVFTLLTLLLLLSTATARAGYDGHVNAENRSRIKIELYSVYDQVPSTGFFPIAISIRNGSRDTHTWTFEATATAAGNSGSLRFYQDLTVEGAQSRTFVLYVPLMNVSPVSAGSPFGNATISGYGILSGSIQFQGGKYGSTYTPYTLMGRNLSLNSWTKIEDHSNKKHRMLRGSTIEASEMLTDWRAYAGVDSIWLSLDEWESLSDLQREAIKGWVYGGGYLQIAIDGGARSMSGFHFAEEIETAHAFGFGSVRQFSTSTKHTIEPEYFETITQSHSATSPVIDEYAAWKLSKDLLENRIPVGILVTLMCLYALLVGPVNMIQFTGPYSRHRLFWTTPVIAAIATIFIGIVIYFRDGLGGDGNRLALFFLNPETNQALLMQEQISRTGMILSDRFAITDPAAIYLVRDISWRDRVTVQHAEDTISGDYFENRKLQKHFIRSYRPSRARFSVQVEDGQYLVQNESGVLLNNLFYIDDSGQVWDTGAIGVGQKTKMRRSSPERMQAGLNDYADRAGSSIRRGLWVAQESRDVFIGITDRPGDLMFDTLDSVRWQHDLAVIVSPGQKSGLEGAI